ncbi:MAG: hypothetical protein DRN88_02735 [Candidatus Hydrothermarchaeota archaeon]|nr:MAG: hypothetical protein DRN88_02735 [Candidatus Hydrothermarchaeota archaeon]
MHILYFYAIINKGYASMGKVMVALSSHRVEALKFIKEEMEKYHAIILEEAPNPWFKPMLQSKISIRHYLSKTYPSFPKFSARLCRILKKFYSKGKEILQIEPYLYTLEKIYEKIEKEKPSPEELEEDEALGIVYKKEKEVFSALLKFYKSSHDFDKAVEATVNFALKDASRIKLRDKLRAEEIKKLEYSSCYVEAGYIHFPLANYLKAKRIFVLEKPTKKLLSAKHALSPSDILTLRLMRIKKPGEKERLLAARSLIYVALLSKNEMLPSKSNPFPHLSEEARIIKFVRNLNYEECRDYFNMLRFVRREDAWKLLEKEGLL